MIGIYAGIDAYSAVSESRPVPLSVYCINQYLLERAPTSSSDLPKVTGTEDIK